MPLQTSLRLNNSQYQQSDLHNSFLAKKLGIPEAEISYSRLLKRSLDARGKTPTWELVFSVSRKGEELEPTRSFEAVFRNVSAGKPVIVVGAGPAGLFACLKLIELGIKPILLERGKALKSRRVDVARVSRGHGVDPESNYCFGLGGAGTFSDGKLYCRSGSSGCRAQIIDKLIFFGAPKDIAIDSHPHIGTNVLPQVVAAIADFIKAAGGEIHYNSRVVALLRDSNSLKGVRLASNEQICAGATILSTGHSAGDIYRMFKAEGLFLERKPLALGVRVEHPSALINELRYGKKFCDIGLPSASYSLKTQAEERGVYSFCMCPGGIICPASTQEGTLVVNGWSPSKRNSKFSNSGLVVEVTENDLNEFGLEGSMAYLDLQNRIESAAWQAGGGHFVAPAARLDTFIGGGFASTLPSCSYNPGVRQSDFSEILPSSILRRLKLGIKDFERKIPGFVTAEAIVLGVESRTSAPVRIPRDSRKLENQQVSGLFPSGEGAGYAGGIMSAALDGERTALAVGKFLS